MDKKKALLSIFKTNPVRDVNVAVLRGNMSEMFRRLKWPSTGRTKLFLKTFPMSPDQANNPQRVKRNGY